MIEWLIWLEQIIKWDHLTFVENCDSTTHSSCFCHNYQLCLSHKNVKHFQSASMQPMTKMKRFSELHITIVLRIVRKQFWRMKIETISRIFKFGCFLLLTNRLFYESFNYFVLIIIKICNFQGINAMYIFQHLLVLPSLFSTGIAP